MPAPQWSSSFLGFSTFNPTSEATNYPASRVGQMLPHPLIRRWRSTTTGQQDIFCDFGSAKTVVAVALLGANFANYALRHSADDVSYTGLANETPVAQDGIDGYYKALFIPASPFTNRYVRLRITASQTTFDGASYYSLGNIVFLSALNTFPREIPTPINIELKRSYVQANTDIIPAGPFFIAEEIKAVLATNEISQLQSIGLLGEHRPLLWYRNWGDLSQVYLMRYTGGMRYTRQSLHWEANPSWTEIV